MRSPESPASSACLSLAEWTPRRTSRPSTSRRTRGGAPPTTTPFHSAMGLSSLQSHPAGSSPKSAVLILQKRLAVLYEGHGFASGVWHRRRTIEPVWESYQQRRGQRTETGPRGGGLKEAPRRRLLDVRLRMDKQLGSVTGHGDDLLIRIVYRYPRPVRRPGRPRVRHMPGNPQAPGLTAAGAHHVRLVGEKQEFSPVGGPRHLRYRSEAAVGSAAPDQTPPRAVRPDGVQRRDLPVDSGVGQLIVVRGPRRHAPSSHLA